MNPSFIIGGTQKAGTSFVHTCISTNPDVFMPDDEISWFELPDFETVPREQFEALFDEAQGRMTGIKRPTYLHSEGCAKRIKSIVPDVKLIFTLRDPVSRIISSYFHNMAYGFIPVVELNRGIELILDGKYKKKYPRSDEILKYSLYYDYLIRYYQQFPAENIKVILLDEIKREGTAVLVDICRFLGISEHVDENALKSRPQSVEYDYKRVKLLVRKLNLLHDRSSDGLRVFKKEKLSFTTRQLLRLIDRRLARIPISDSKPGLNKKNTERLKTY
jgi:hypothetical protein